MTFNNFGTNSASTKDWLEAMKNQSSTGVEPRHASGELNGVLTREQFENALKEVDNRPLERNQRTRG